MGAENVGKSTLIENLTKCAIFPRDSKICTKCPVKLCVVEDPDANAAAQVTFRGEERVVDKSAILERVSAIMTALPAEEIIADEICVTIRGPDLPNLEFIDLPGIREFPEGMARASQGADGAVPAGPRHAGRGRRARHRAHPHAQPGYRLRPQRRQAGQDHHRPDHVRPGKQSALFASPMSRRPPAALAIRNQPSTLRWQVQGPNFTGRVINRLLEKNQELEGHK
jgi:hypothetical protein